MENAIKKSIEGGYYFITAHSHLNGIHFNAIQSEERCLRSIFDDPLFWQCLGKSLGWGKMFCLICLRKEPELNKCNCKGQVYDVSPTWRYHWHSFIDHLAEGKSPDEFFNSLISK